VLGDLDRRTVARGAAATLVLAVPAAIASSLLADHQPSPHAVLSALSLVLLVGFAIGGFVAGSESADLPAKHAAAAALVAFVIVQAFGILARATRGATINVVRIAATGMLAVSAGLIGGLLAARRRSVS